MTAKLKILRKRIEWAQRDYEESVRNEENARKNGNDPWWYGFIGKRRKARKEAEAKLNTAKKELEEYEASVVMSGLVEGLVK